MAVAAYYTWDAAGRPWREAVWAKETNAKLEAAFPEAVFGSIGNEAHLQAEPPQDHTPFSQTGWPVPHPYPWVNAIDVMHNRGGVDCNVLFPYWLAEAKAGRMPWLKYMIWQAKRYDVRNNWVPVASSGHFDHVHKSGLSSRVTTSIGAWSPLPPGGSDMSWQEIITSPSMGFTAPASEWMKDAVEKGRMNKSLNEQNKTLSEQILAKVDEIATPTVALSDEDLTAISVRVADLLMPQIRDAIADLGEGGAVKVRSEA